MLDFGSDRIQLSCFTWVSDQRTTSSMSVLADWATASTPVGCLLDLGICC